MPLAKADFYYGALLSQLVNSGFAPAIIDQGEARRVYEITNNTADFKVYAKYVSKPVNTEVENKRWDFSFNEEEVQTVLNDVSMNMFAFVCGIDSLRDSEICFCQKNSCENVLVWIIVHPLVGLQCVQIREADTLLYMVQHLNEQKSIKSNTQPR